MAAPNEVRRLLVAGAWESTAHEYLAWVSALDLPDPERLLADPDGADFSRLRADRVYVVLQAVLGAVVRKPTEQRWTDAVRLCAKAAGAVWGSTSVTGGGAGADLRPTARCACPAGYSLVFMAALSLAGLFPEPV